MGSADRTAPRSATRNRAWQAKRNVEILPCGQPLFRVVGLRHGDIDPPEREVDPTCPVTPRDAKPPASRLAKGGIQCVADDGSDSKKPLAGIGIQRMHHDRSRQKFTTRVEARLEEVEHLRTGLP